MLKYVRETIIQQLWNAYFQTTPQIREVVNGLTANNKGMTIPLDHFACIDLPGPHTGIPVLETLFKMLGFNKGGQGYLASKQNDFTWLAENNANGKPAHSPLPQVVVADFRLDEMTPKVRAIIEKYSSLATPVPFDQIQSWIHDEAITALQTFFANYFKGRDWPLPTVEEFKIVHDFNELLAWVLVFGRKPNHFTVSVHLLSAFNNLVEFNEFIEKTLKLSLNQEGGVIKGTSRSGIAQSSTMGLQETIKLADGHVSLPTGFVEFVWRFPNPTLTTKPILWGDYFTGFVADHADHVIESLFQPR